MGFDEFAEEAQALLRNPFTTSDDYLRFMLDHASTLLEILQFAARAMDRQDAMALRIRTLERRNKRLRGRLRRKTQAHSN